MDNTLNGKWALVTGSTRGIGRQVALALAEHGCNVIVHGRTEQHCAGILEEISALDVECFAAPGELGTSEGEAAVIDAVKSADKAVDILYNNAGIMSSWNESMFDIPLNEWTRIFQINLFAMVHLCNAFVPDMVKRGWGRVVNVTSGMSSEPQLSPYSVSKGAVNTYTRELAAELKGTGVLANAMDPGWLRTDMGGAQADHSVESVIPGALVPVLLNDDAGGGKVYCAQDPHQ